MNLSSFYHSKEWENLSKLIRAERINDTGDLLCEECGKVIVRPYDAICHHVEHLTETNVHDASIALNPDNIQVVCRRCHNKIHERFGFNKTSYVKPTKRVYVVWGSPCSGKTTYVEECAGEHDLIVDIDRLYKAMGMSRSNKLTGNVLQIYRNLIDMVKTRNGKWHNAWIMRTLPLKIDRELILKEVGGDAELIHVDTPKDECFMRAYARGGESVKWCEKFWNEYQAP